MTTLTKRDEKTWKAHLKEIFRFAFGMTADDAMLQSYFDNCFNRWSPRQSFNGAMKVFGKNYFIAEDGATNFVPRFPLSSLSSLEVLED